MIFSITITRESPGHHGLSDVWWDGIAVVEKLNEVEEIETIVGNTSQPVVQPYYMGGCV